MMIDRNWLSTAITMPGPALVVPVPGHPNLAIDGRGGRPARGPRPNQARTG